MQTLSVEALDDLSAQMAFLYLADYDRHSPAQAVSNNHFDQDGLVGLYALAHPDESMARRQRLVEVARAGDFATCTDRDAARISMVIAAYADAERSPLDLPTDYNERTFLLYQELLGKIAALCDHPGSWRPLWEAEDEALRAGEHAISSGKVGLVEISDVDLAVATWAEGPVPGHGGHRFAHMWVGGLHPMAIYNASDCMVVATVQGQSYELTCRYETWVQYHSRSLRARRDLRPLAERLNQVEGSGGQWVADEPGHLTPVLRLQDAEGSTLQPARFQRMVEAYLREAPPAWP